jgi:hypothetical protein
MRPRFRAAMEDNELARCRCKSLDASGGGVEHRHVARHPASCAKDELARTLTNSWRSNLPPQGGGILFPGSVNSKSR